MRFKLSSTNTTAESICMPDRCTSGRQKRVKSGVEQSTLSCVYGPALKIINYLTPDLSLNFRYATAQSWS